MLAVLLFLFCFVFVSSKVENRIVLKSNPCKSQKSKAALADFEQLFLRLVMRI